jgi:hypothetical protein
MHPGEFGLQVRLPQTFHFNQFQHTQSRCDAAVTHSNRSAGKMMIFRTLLGSGKLPS